MNKNTPFYLYLIGLFFTFVFFILSCGDKKEEENIKPPTEISADKEKEIKDREEFLNIKEQQLKDWEERLKAIDTAKKYFDTTRTLKKELTDTTKTQQINKEDTKFTQKEKELNKRLDNPKSAIVDYLEYIKRGVSDGKFDENMKNAADVWMKPSVDRFKANYKNTKSFTVLSEPEVISSKGNTATVRVKVKKKDMIKSGNQQSEKETTMTVTYNLVADKNGRWRIQNNIVSEN